MNGNLTKIVVIVTGVAVSVSSGWIASVVGYGERIARVETAIMHMQKDVGRIEGKIDRIVESL